MIKKENQKELFEAKRTHSGQYKRYGDSFYKWEVISDLPKEEVLSKCFTDLAKAKYPTKEEWWRNIANEKRYDMRYYFHGYYTFTEAFFDVDAGANGYYFTVCHPYTD